LTSYAKTGVEGYKVEAVYADARAKPDIRDQRAIRLIEQEKVDMLLGFFFVGAMRAGGAASSN